MSNAGSTSAWQARNPKQFTHETGSNSAGFSKKKVERRKVSQFAKQLQVKTPRKKIPPVMYITEVPVFNEELA